MSRLILCAFCALVACAGQVDAGSIFSFNGQGYPVRRLDPRSTGMGGAGRAIVDGTNMSSFNPALLGAFQRPAMFGQYALQRRNVDDRNTSRAIADGDLTGIKTVFPFRFRGAFTVGMEALTDVDITLVDTVGTGGEEHLLGLKGTGGISAIVLGFGQKIGKRLFLGAHADLVVVGTLTESWTKDLLEDLLDDSEPFFSKDTVTRSQRGVQFTFGGVYTPGNMSIALVARPKATITQKVLVENRLTTNAITFDAVETERDIEFPATFGAGLAYARSELFLVAFDLEYAGWESTAPGRHNTLETALGIQYQMLPDNARRIGRRYDLMAGVYRRTLYFATSTGEQIAEMGVSLGLGIPFERESGKFRWTLDVGVRGDTQVHSASETYFKQTFSVAGWIQ